MYFSQTLFSLLDNLSRGCIFKTFRMNEQPVSQILFEGDWGRCSNKPFSEMVPKETSRKWVNLYRFALLATLWMCKISVKIISKSGIISLLQQWKFTRKSSLPYCFLNLCSTWAQVIFKTSATELVPKTGRSNKVKQHFSPSWREVASYNCYMN